MLRSWWSARGQEVLVFAAGLMAVATVVNLVTRFAQLLFWGGGRDLKHRFDEAHRYFDGAPIYQEMFTANYPPASYVMLWPFVGFPSLVLVKWIWAFTSLAVLAWLAFLLVRESGAQTRRERSFIALLPLCAYATGSTIGHGQLTIHILPCLLLGLILICRGPGSWRDDLLGGALVLAALVKPTISAPFFWLVLFVPGRLRPALLVGLGYVVVSLFATEFQGFGIVSAHLAWVENLGNASSVASAGTGLGLGNYGNLNTWLGAMGLVEWNLAASLLALLALAAWTIRHRQADFWLLLGVVALVARLWSYHRLYDDMLILFPMITLFRIAKQGAGSDGHDVVAGVLLASALVALMFPSTLLGYLPGVGSFLLDACRSLQTGIWLAMLLFLLYRAAFENKRRRAEQASGVGLAEVPG